MIDKVQKIREGVERLKSQLLRGACSSQVAMETMCKEEAYNEVLAILDTMQEEPVSDDLKEAAIEICSKVLEGETVVIDGYEYVVLSDAEECFKAGAKWQKEQMMANAIDGTARPYDNEIWCNLAYSNLEDGNKVKVIVIKED